MAKKTQNVQSSHFHIKTELMQRALDKRQRIELEDGKPCDKRDNNFV